MSTTAYILSASTKRGAIMIVFIYHNFKAEKQIFSASASSSQSG